MSPQCYLCLIEQVNVSARPFFYQIFYVWQIDLKTASQRVQNYFMSIGVRICYVRVKFGLKNPFFAKLGFWVHLSVPLCPWGALALAAPSALAPISDPPFTQLAFLGGSSAQRPCSGTDQIFIFYKITLSPLLPSLLDIRSTNLYLFKDTTITYNGSVSLLYTQSVMLEV